jgi:hypothetical protein
MKISRGEPLDYQEKKASRNITIPAKKPKAAVPTFEKVEPKNKQKGEKST